jgi:hypothetical protein
MTSSWSADDVQHLDRAEELEISTGRPDGTWRPWVPIWVVVVEGSAYVRTWHRRDTGWYGQAVGSGRARIRVPGLTADVVVADVGDGGPALRAGVDAAYRGKYARYGDATTARMVDDGAAASTLRLTPD